MQKFRINYLIAWLLSCLPCTCVPAQMIIYQQGFEEAGGTLNYSSDVASYGNGGVPTWGAVTELGAITAAAEGQRFWGARDVENATSGQAVSRLTFDAGNICNLTSAKFVFKYNVIGYDAGDDFGYELYIDGFLDREELLIDGRNGGGVSTAGWVEASVAIPGTAQTAKLVVYFDQNGDDLAAIDDVQVVASGTSGSCSAHCGINLGTVDVSCAGFTSGADPVLVKVAYSGGEVGAQVSLGGATIGGDDPALQYDGVIELSGLTEGNNYILSVSGGDCALSLPISIQQDHCAPSSLVINEILAAPGEDINNDGSINPADEFVTIYNAGTEAADMSDCSIHEGSNSGARFTFPAGTTIAPGDKFVVFAGMGDGGFVVTDCDYGIANGFLGLNDDQAESVTLRDETGRVVAQADFADAPDGESLILNPDGNLDGGYWPYSQVDASGTSSACRSTAMPVELTHFEARATEKTVVLEWATSVEVDNDYFLIERSQDGRSFTALASVPAGKGSYRYVDKSPYSGHSYYRLRQVDIGGAVNLYGPVSANKSDGRVTLRPNPVLDLLHLSNYPAAGVELTIISSRGETISHPAAESLDVSDLSPGLYYLHISTPQGTQTLRFVKR